MWIVRIALSRPYTFVVFALIIFILSGVAIMRTPMDIFPNIDIPVVAVDWTYTGLNPEELEGRLILLSQKVAAVVAENQIIEEIQILAHGGPDESQARQGQRSTICGVC